MKVLGTRNPVRGFTMENIPERNCAAPRRLHGIFAGFAALVCLFGAASGAPGDLEASFDLDADYTIDTFAIQSDGRILMGGEFSRIGGFHRPNLARLEPSGALDTSFDPWVDGRVLCAAVQPDGRILIGGRFSRVGGVLRSGLARLHPDGTLDAAFNPTVEGPVVSVALQADGKIILAGEFSTSNLARVHADGSLDSAFAPQVASDGVRTALQRDGKILVGGFVSSVGGVERTGLVRIETDGAWDAGFVPALSGAAFALAEQVDGKIVAAGSFETAGELEARHLARFQMGGALDEAFQPILDAVPDGIAIQSDGRIVIWGSFSTVNGVARPHLARLEPDGTLDLSFAVRSVTQVFSASLEADGKVLVSGILDEVTGGLRYDVGRLENDAAPVSLMATSAPGVEWLRGGSSPEVVAVDFAASADLGVTWSALGAGARVAGGWERTGLSLPAACLIRARGRAFGGQYNHSSSLVETIAAFPANAPPTVANPIGRIVVVDEDAADTVIDMRAVFEDAETADADLTFALAGVVPPHLATAILDPATDVLTIHYHARQHGAFSLNVRATDAVGLAAHQGFLVKVRRVADGDPGDVDLSFDPGESFGFASIGIATLALQPDGKIVLGGGLKSWNGVPRSHLARLHPDASLDSSFAPVVDNPLYPTHLFVHSTTVQADGKILVGGEFASVNGLPRNNLARVHSNGALDPGFNPDVNDFVGSAALQSDGKVVIAGRFGTVGGAPGKYLVRLEASGALEMVSELQLFADLYGAILQPDAKIIAFGGPIFSDGIFQAGIARFHPDGTLDPTFLNPGAEYVDFAGLQADGKMIIGGRFHRVSGVARHAIARLRSDGTLDAAFDPQVEGYVWTAAVQADGRIVIGGSFTSVNGVARRNLARLEPDGSLDPDFDPDINNTVVLTALQGDGRALVAGDFTEAGEVSRNGLVRLENDPAPQSLTVPDGSRVQWLRGGSSPETHAVAFDLSTDGGTTWTPLGAGLRIAGGWARNGLSLPASGLVRGLARVPGSCFSSGLVSTVAGFGPDTDGDGLRDAWELLYWPTLAGHSAHDDFDRDGLSELLELAFGLNPTLADAAAQPAVSGSGGYLTISIARQAGVAYEVHTAGTVASGQPGSFSAATTAVLLDTPTMLQVRDTAPIGTLPSRFLRVKVTAMP